MSVVTITRTAWIDDDGSGTTGTVINNAVKTSIYDQIDEALALLLPLSGGTMAGDLLFTDATYDVGKSGATRPRDGFFSRNFVIGGTLTVVGAATMAAITMAGDLLFTDATYDIGKSGATRPRDGFFSRNVVIGGTLGVTGAATLSSTLAVTGTTTLTGNIVSDVKFTDDTYDIGKNGATRPRDGFFSRNVVIGGTLTAGPTTISGTTPFTSTSSAGDYVGIFQNSNTTPGASYGVVITAGTNSSDYAVRVRAANNTELFNIFGSGGVRIATFGAGTLVTDGSGNVTASSDGRLKQILGALPYGLAEVKQLAAILHKWLPESGMETKGVYPGFDARKVFKIMPEVAPKDARGKHTLIDRGLIGALVNAVIEMDQRLAELEAA